jgi:hypothetical protein
MHNVVIEIRSDATTSVAYINKQGGSKPHLSHPVIEFLRWCWTERKITFIASHVAGVNNVVADTLSRTSNAWTELELHPLAFLHLEMIWGPHTVDLMASQPNCKVDRYFSWRPDPASAGIDVMVQDLRGEQNPYLFPPDPMIPRILHLIRQQGAGPITMVTPLWPAQHWFPLLLELVVDLPVILNHHSRTLVLPPLLVDKGCPTPTWTMVAWRICGRDFERKDFLRELFRLSSQTGKEAPMADISMLLSSTGPLSQQDAALLTRILRSWTSSTFVM